MECYKITSSDYEKLYLNIISCDKIGAKILADKSTLHHLYIKDLKTPACNILKQDTLSIGADFAMPKGVIIGSKKYNDGVLIGTTKHFKILSKKLKIQPFGLKELSNKLNEFLSKQSKRVKIMGVINVNDDSFYPQSRFNGNSAIAKIKQMIKDGADIVDIGAVSSKPFSKEVLEYEEMERIKPIIDEIYKQKLYEKTIFSVDSYRPKVIDYALNKGFKIANDITGLQDENIARVVSKYDASVVIMHMQNTPQDMQDNPTYNNIILDIDRFFQKRIEFALKHNVKDIILDVGIGFGKTLEHNLELLRQMEHFCHFGYEILVGASRKSLIDKIVPSSVENRLSGTIAIHLDVINKGVSIVRTHDVKEHYQAIKVWQSINMV